MLQIHWSEVRHAKEEEMQARVREHQRRWVGPSCAFHGLRKCRRGAFKFERKPPFEYGRWIWMRLWNYANSLQIYFWGAWAKMERLFAYYFGHIWTLPTSHPRRSLIKTTWSRKAGRNFKKYVLVYSFLLFSWGHCPFWGACFSQSGWIKDHCRLILDTRFQGKVRLIWWSGLEVWNGKQR